MDLGSCGEGGRGIRQTKRVGEMAKGEREREVGREKGEGGKWERSEKGREVSGIRGVEGGRERRKESGEKTKLP